MRESIALSIAESSQAGEARRIAIALATRLNFNETERGKVGLVVTELANNLVRHAQEGQLLLQAIQQDDQIGIEILAIDKGPGIRNIQECLRDGFSTAGTPGNGLGAVQRLSSFFDLYSIPDEGTVMLSRLWADPLAVASLQERLEVGAICLPKVGEEVSGDAWSIEVQEQQILLLVADGLGHGPMAAQASLEAVRIFHENAHHRPKTILETTHTALRSTRGAALAIAAISFNAQSVCFSGIGNIAGSIQTAERSSSMVSHNGTVGHEVRKVQEFNYLWQSDSLLIMHSDGLGSQWRLDRYPSLRQKHPSLIAGVLYRDFNRGRDDVTVLVAKERDSQ